MKLATALLPMLLITVRADRNLKSEKEQMRNDINRLRNDLDDLIDLVEGGGQITNSHEDRIDGAEARLNDLERTMKEHNLGQYGHLHYHDHDDQARRVDIDIARMKEIRHGKRAVSMFILYTIEGEK